MALAIYDDLVTSVGNWLNRRDLTAAIPDFITLAETKFSRKLRTRDMIARVLTNVTTDYTQLPTDFRQAISLKISAGGQWFDLDFKSEIQMVQCRQANTNLGRPRYYTFLADAVQLNPAPDLVYVLSMSYYASIPALVAGAGNWLLTKHPDAYLYGCLLESAPYLKDDARIPVWQSAYDRAMGDIQQEDDRSKFSGKTPAASFARIG